MALTLDQWRSLYPNLIAPPVIDNAERVEPPAEGVWPPSRETWPAPASEVDGIDQWARLMAAVETLGLPEAERKSAWNEKRQWLARVACLATVAA